MPKPTTHTYSGPAYPATPSAHARLARDLLKREQRSMHRKAELIDAAVLSGGAHPDMLFITYSLAPLEAGIERTLTETRYAAVVVGNETPSVSGIVGSTWEEVGPPS